MEGLRLRGVEARDPGKPVIAGSARDPDEGHA